MPYKNRDDKLANDAKYRAENKELVKSSIVSAKIANPEKYMAIARAWKKANPDKVKELSARYRKKHRESLNKKCRDYQKLNPEIIRAKNSRKRSILLQSEGTFTDREWVDLCSSYSNVCLCCEEVNVNLTVDHVIPLSKGGRNDVSNLQPLCGPCNYKKSTKIIDFRAKFDLNTTKTG